MQFTLYHKESNRMRGTIGEKYVRRYSILRETNVELYTADAIQVFFFVAKTLDFLNKLKNHLFRKQAKQCQ